MAKITVNMSIEGHICDPVEMELVGLPVCPFCGSDCLEVTNTHTPCFTVECQDCGGNISGDSYTSEITSSKSGKLFSGRTLTNRLKYAEAYRKAVVSAVYQWGQRGPAVGMSISRARDMVLVLADRLKGVVL